MKFIRAFLWLWGSASVALAQYEANWESLDSRPLPSWFDESKIGILLHWGVYSVPSFGNENFWWFWKGTNTSNYVDFMKKNYPPNFTYAGFAPQFTAEFYDPNQWADLFKSAGAKYIVMCAKHSEGYALWPSSYSFNWNAMDVGPQRDLLGDLATAVRSKDLRFGIYYEFGEWFNPAYKEDEANGFKTNNYVNLRVMPELHELVNTYEPDYVYTYDNLKESDVYLHSTEFLAWLYNESPVQEKVVVNDQWGIGTQCTHGCVSFDSQHFPENRKWEGITPLDNQSHAYRRNAVLANYLSIETIITYLTEKVSNGGNILLYIGPTHDGRIIPIMEERLRQLGEWLSINGEAIYKSRPWTTRNDTLTSGLWYTQSSSGDVVYAIALDWPSGSILKLGAISPGSFANVTLFGHDGKLEWTTTGSGIEVTFPLQSEVSSQWAWVLKFVL